MKQQLFGIILIVIIAFSACTVTKKVKDGVTAFQLKQYSVAVDLLEKEYQNETSRDVKYFKACLLYTSPSPRDRG